MNKKTIKEAAKEHEIDFATTASLSEVCVSAFEAGAEWIQEDMFCIMQDYAEFCIRCDREGLKPICAQDWYNERKKTV